MSDEGTVVMEPEQPVPVIVIRFPPNKPIDISHEGLNDFMLPSLLRKVANQVEKTLTQSQ